MILEEDKRTLCDKPQQARRQEKGLCPVGRQQAGGASIRIEAPPCLIGYVRSVKTAVSVQQSSFPNIA